MKPTAEYDPLDLQGREAARKETEDAKAHRRRIEQEDLRWLMADKRGRRFMHRLFSVGHLYETSVVAGDPYLTHVREGERNVGLRFLSDVMEACPERFNTMLMEKISDDHPRSSDRATARKR
jgi:hypothetical protein